MVERVPVALMTAVIVAREVTLLDDEVEPCCPGRAMYTRLRAWGAVEDDEATMYAIEQTNMTTKSQKNAFLTGCDFLSGGLMAQILHLYYSPEQKKELTFKI
jgi:hypothetical protein